MARDGDAHNDGNDDDEKEDGEGGAAALCPHELDGAHAGVLGVLRLLRAVVLHGVAVWLHEWRDDADDPEWEEHCGS